MFVSTLTGSHTHHWEKPHLSFLLSIPLSQIHSRHVTMGSQILAFLYSCLFIVLCCCSLPFHWPFKLFYLDMRLLFNYSLDVWALIHRISDYLWEIQLCLLIAFQLTIKYSEDRKIWQLCVYISCLLVLVKSFVMFLSLNILFRLSLLNTAVSIAFDS